MAKEKSLTVAKYISAQVDLLKDTKQQLEIAKEAGFEKANMITMIKQGKSNLPLAKVAAMAKALNVDPAHLLMLTLREYYPEIHTTVQGILGRQVSNNEYALIERWREKTDNLDPALAEQQDISAFDAFAEQLMVATRATLTRVKKEYDERYKAKAAKEAAKQSESE